MEVLNSVGWSNLLTMILVVVTGVYVFLTWKIANANQRMLERVEEQYLEQMRPVVYAYLEFREQVVVRLIIENIGRTPAIDLKVSIDKDFYPFADTNRRNLKELPIFAKRTSWLPPKAKIALDLSQGFNLIS